MQVKGIEIPVALQNCRNVWLYSLDGEWIIASRSQEIARFKSEKDALSWWSEFETTRGFNVKTPKRLSPNFFKNFKAISSSILNARKVKQTSPERRQAILAYINQGRFDDEKKLLNLMKNASDREENTILNAVHQRLKIVAPNTYRKLVGPLPVRDPLGKKVCYCGHPKSLSEIKDAIRYGIVPEECLLCDDCWNIDICSAWGYYGKWGAKIIDTEQWRVICERRGDTKYATL